MVAGEANLVAREARAALDSLKEIKIDHAKRSSDGNLALAKVSTRWMLLMALFGLSVGAMFGLLLSRSITKPLGEAVSIADKLSLGDLRSDIAEDHCHRKDEIGHLACSIQRMMSSLKEIISSVRASAMNVSSGSDQISATAQQLSQGATEQAAAAEEVSSSVEQLAATVRQNADNAGAAESIARKSAEDAGKGGGAVGDTVAAIKDIAGRISIIEEIARQTNLLA